MKLTAPKAGENVSLLVAVRVRPVLKSEQPKTKDVPPKKDILRVIDKRMVLVMDPEDPDEKDYLDQVQNRSKEKKYTFDVAFGAECTNSKLYKATIAPLIKHVINGHNCTVFAYGATGSGKTYTMVGGSADSGLMVRSMESLFAQSAQLRKDEDVTITASYLEVYNEVLYDLLVPNSAELPLREDPVLGAVPSGLTFANVSSANDILHLLETGNARRKTERTDANTQSSRSHAVLEVHLKRQGRNHYKSRQLVGKLALVDLAGSERAAETNNFGQKLRDGANINRSLLSLANCINQLGKAGASGGRAYIPYRNSKLTRLLKDGLSGNSRTVMIATVAASADQYHHSINTLKYANRAKDIKTHIVQNVGSVESHISDYRRIIDNLQGEVRQLKEQLVMQEESRSPSVAGTDMNITNMHPEGVSLFDTLVSSIHNGVAERINLQKALFEVQDADVRTRMQLEALQNSLRRTSIDSEDSNADMTGEAEELAQRIQDNEAEIALLRGAIEANEVSQQSVQARIDGTIEGQGSRNPQLLKMLKQFRLQALQLVELEFQMAVRDQIIDEQRSVVGNLWKVLGELAPSERISDIACELGIEVDNAVEGTVQVPSFASGCIAAVAAVAAAVTTGTTAPRTSISTLQGNSAARSSLAPSSSGRRNSTSSAAPFAATTSPSAAASAVAGRAGSGRSPDPVPTSQGAQDSLPLGSSRSLPVRRSRDAFAGPLEDGGDATGILSSMSMGMPPAGAPLFPRATLNSCIPEDSVPVMDGTLEPNERNKTPTAWEEPAAVPSDKNDKGQDRQSGNSATKPTSGTAAKSDAPSTGAGMMPSIGIQGMRVLSSLKVAGWSLAGGGGARSAHVMKDERDTQIKEKLGPPSPEVVDPLRASPIRGWGALDHISSPSLSPVRSCDPEASQAARTIMAGISGRGPVSMHAVCASVEENVDDGRMTPTDGDGLWTEDDSVEGKRCTSFSFRTRQHHSLRAKLSSPQGNCAGTSKARGSGNARTSLGMRLLGSLRSTRVSRRNSMGGRSGTDGPPRTASGGGELDSSGGRVGLGDEDTGEGGASRGSGGVVSRESDRVMPFSKQEADVQQEPHKNGTSSGQRTEASQRKETFDAGKGLRLQGTSAEAPSVMHAWRGPTNSMATVLDRMVDVKAPAEAATAAVAAAAAASSADASTTAAPIASADTSPVGVGDIGGKTATGEVWDAGFKERRRVVGGSIAVPSNATGTTAEPQTTATASGACAGATLPQFGMGVVAAGIEGLGSKGVGGLSGGSHGSMAPSERLKRLKSHRDRSARVSITKQISDGRLKDFAMEVVGGGVQGGGSKIKP